MNKILKVFTYIDGVNDNPFPSASNQLEIYDFTYTAQRMGDVSLTATVMLGECYDNIWTGKEYITFNDEKYFIIDTPSSSKDNMDTRYKHDIIFKSERDILNNVYFFDVVESSSTAYSSNGTDVIFYGDIAQLASRLNASLTYSGVDYSVVVDSDISSSEKQVSFSDQFIFSVLQQTYELFEIPFYFIGKVIHLGFTSNAITNVLEYGIENSLLSITKTNSNYKVVTSCTGIGSGENIPFYYPNASNDREAIEASGGTWIKPMQNLMPPIYRETFGKKMFYNALNSTYINPETGLYYEFENVYNSKIPKEQKVTFDNIKPSIKEIKNGSNVRIDQILDIAFDTNDNDKINENNEYEHPYFFIKLNKFNGTYGFNLFNQSIVGSDMMVEMTSGDCAACKFMIGVTDDTQKNIVQVDTNGNLLRDANGNVIVYGDPQPRQNDTINYNVWLAVKKDDSTFGVIMPNVGYNYKPHTGDVFALTGIDLPQSYITNAENKLKEELIKYMYLNNTEKFNFSIKFSRIYLAGNPLVFSQLNENARVVVSYNNIQQTLYINTYTYTQKKEESLPEINVDVSDVINVNKNSIQTSIDSVKKEIMDSVGSIDFYKQGLKYFLRKDVSDRTAFTLASNSGFEIGRYVNGMLGSGGWFGMDSNGKSFAEVDKLYVRIKAFFDTIEINKVQANTGNRIQSSAGIKCNNVEDIGTYYRCFFKEKEENTEITNDFVVGDQAYCKEFNLKNGTHYYWRLVVGKGDNYIDLSKDDADSNSDIPMINDDIIQLGNRNDATRQNAIVESTSGQNTPSYIMYQGINSFSLDGKGIISLGYNSTTGKPYMSVYGDAYIGSEDGSSYIKNNTTTQSLEIKGDVTITGGVARTEIDNIEDALNKISDDNLVSPSEKPYLRQEIVNIDSINSLLQSESSSLQILTDSDYTNYQSNYTIYRNLLTELSSIDPEYISLVGKNYDNIRQSFYNAKDILANKISVKKQENIDQSISSEEQARIQAISDVNDSISDLQNQIDGVVDNWFYEYSPTNANFPASEWTTTEEKDRHLGDTFTNITEYVDATTTPDAGKSWRWAYTDSSHTGYHWHVISDSDAVKALQEAANAQATADGKSSTFVVQPTLYSKGDTWILASDATINGVAYKKGDTLNASQGSTIFIESHWSKKVRYTDDTAVDTLQIGGVNLIDNSELITTTTTTGAIGYIGEISLKTGDTYIISYATNNSDKTSFYLNTKKEWTTGNRQIVNPNIPFVAQYDLKHIWVQGTTGTTVTITKLKLENGDKATAWSKSPNDVKNDYTQTAEEKATAAVTPYQYLKDVFQDYTTTISGGVILSKFIGVSDESSNVVAGMTSVAPISGGSMDTYPMIFAGSLRYDWAQFAKTRIYRDGRFYSQNAEIEGTVTATSGKIGGFTISGNNLINNNGYANIFMSYAASSDASGSIEIGNLGLAFSSNQKPIIDINTIGYTNVGGIKIAVTDPYPEDHNPPENRLAIKIDAGSMKLAENLYFGDDSETFGGSNSYVTWSYSTCNIVTLTKRDFWVFWDNTTTLTATLPSEMKTAKEYRFRKIGSGNIIINIPSGSTDKIWANGSAATTIAVDYQKMLILVYYPKNKYWIANYIAF